MAMAFLEREGSGGPATVRFRADLGSSRFWSYRIGPAATVEEDGFELMADPVHVAPLAGPLPPERLGRTVIDVPAGLFDRDNPYIQLVSYREAPDIGPAVSEMVHAGPAAGARPRREPGGPVMTVSPTHQRPTRLPVEAFALQERPFSEAMFLQALLPILNNALPIIGQLAPLVGSLVGGGGGTGGGTGGGAGTAAGGTANPQTIKDLVGAVQQILALFGKAQTPAAEAPAAQSATWGGSGYTEAAIAPALLAALPALAPLVEKALNPETLKAIGQITPTGQANAANEQVRQHLEKILPSSDTAQIYQLLALLAMQESTRSLHGAMPPFSPAPDAALHLDAAADAGIVLGTRARRLYRNDRACTFPLTVSTPRAIPRPRLRWQVKRATSADVLVDEERELDTVGTSGPLPAAAVVSAADMARLAPGEEHVLCAYLLFTTGSGRTLGLTAMVPFTPVGEYCYDGVTGTERDRTFALNDVDAHRDFWHKVWQATLTDEVFRYRYECKYYYGLDPDADVPVRAVTRVQDEPRELHTQLGRLESSMRLGLRGLNALLPRLAPDLRPLAEAELAALRTRSFAARFDTAARFEAHLGGRRGTSVALWVFPELKLASVLLRRCSDVDASGRVTAVTDRTVSFPVPAAATFVGVTSDSG